MFQEQMILTWILKKEFWMKASENKKSFNDTARHYTGTMRVNPYSNYYFDYISSQVKLIKKS